jgi:hypothetical protein
VFTAYAGAGGAQDRACAVEAAAGPGGVADRVGVAPSTAHAVPRRCWINRLSHVDRATGEPIRRYERDRPGELIHVDVKKLGNIPDGGGQPVDAIDHGDAPADGRDDGPRIAAHSEAEAW